MKFRGLKPEEIDIRIGTVGAKGVTLLLYKDARVDMNILDETLGFDGWQREHKEIKGNVYCGIGIWSDKTNSWVWKWDCGTESFTEKEKGEASDSFKRAGFSVGIGRELYSSPFIFVSCETKKRDGGRGYELSDAYAFNGAYVDSIEYEESDNTRTIKKLVLKYKNGNTFYEFGTGKKSAPKTTPKTTTPATKETKMKFVEVCNTLGLDVRATSETFGLKNSSTEEDFKKAIETLNK